MIANDKYTLKCNNRNLLIIDLDYGKVSTSVIVSESGPLADMFQAQIATMKAE
jgi:hypothetical protein